MKEEKVFVEQWLRGINILILKSSGHIDMADRIRDYHGER